MPASTSTQTAHTPNPTPKPSRPLLIAFGAVLAAGLIAAGTIWAVTAASSSEAQTASATGTLPADTRMGVVALVTDDLGPMRDYYVDAVGLEVLAETEQSVELGLEDTPLLTLTEDSAAAVDDPRRAGLYHSAILYPDAPSLARTIYGIATTAPQSYAGSADHAVSLAFYFSDPDGNGLELYTDTPESTWVWENGMVQMGSAPLDPNAFIAEHLETAPGDGETVMGHVHLRVGDLDAARGFYSDILGFDVTAETDGALFYSAGGYHHHLATNTWSSAGAGARPDSQGLAALTVHLGSDEALTGLADRLAAAGLDFSNESGRISVDDPWGNTVIVTSS